MTPRKVNPRPVTVEKAAHALFAHARSHGEWFRLDAIEGELLEIAEKGSL